jgi:hypothetical protein
MWKTNLARRLGAGPEFDDGDGDFVTLRLHRDQVDVLLSLCQDQLRRQGIEPKAPEETPRPGPRARALRLVRGTAALILAMLGLILPAVPALAQTPRARTACATVQIDGGAAFGGMDIQAAVAGNGIFIESVVVDAATGAYAARTSSAAVLTASLATIAPLATFGQGALTTIVREGTAPATLGEGAMLLVGDTTVFDTLPPIWVAPGSFFTVQRTTTGTTNNATVCWTEAP